VIGRLVWAEVLRVTRGTALQRRAYRRYLRSAAWRANQARAAAKARARGRCESCGKRRRGLQAHHLTYARPGRERASDFRMLCPACHAAEHRR